MRWWLTTLFLLLAGSAAADLQMDMSPVPDSILIGDPIAVQITIEAPDDGQLMMPDLTQILPPFELLAAPEISQLPGTPDRKRLELSFTATTYEAGEQVLQPIPLQWVSSDSLAFDSASTEPWIIHVEGVIPDSILSMAQQSGQAYHYLQGNRGRRIAYNIIEFIPYVLIVLAVAALYFALRWWLRRRKKIVEQIEEGPPPRPAHIIALEALDSLRDQKLYQSGEIKAYYSLLSEILRQYIEARFDLPAMELTSFQLLRDIDPKLNNHNLKTVLETILNDADLAKFAKHRPDEDTCRKDLENGYVFVQKTRPSQPRVISGEAA